MTAPEFEARVVEWARRLPALAALVQIGSRVQPGAVVDAWSDWDYHLILRSAMPPFRREDLAAIAPCWTAHTEGTERGVQKLSAVFAGGHEADFVLLPAWQMKLVFQAMRHPGAAAWYPASLRTGIRNLRLFARPGYRVLLGGPAWEKRYAALAVDWPTAEFSAADFAGHTAAAWRHAVWVAKKILRGELRAAERGLHREVREHLYVLLAEEARLAGRGTRPEARSAEQWLTAGRLQQTSHPTGPDARMLAAALLADMTLFREVNEAVAVARGFARPEHADTEAWLRAELAKLTG